MPIIYTFPSSLYTVLPSGSAQLDEIEIEPPLLPAPTGATRSTSMKVKSKAGAKTGVVGEIVVSRQAITGHSVQPTPAGLVSAEVFSSVKFEHPAAANNSEHVYSVSFQVVGSTGSVINLTYRYKSAELNAWVNVQQAFTIS